jgi:two-component system sensor histidine kinase VanS
MQLICFWAAPTTAAIVPNLPEHGTVHVTTASGAESVVLTVESTGGGELTPQLVSTLIGPFQRGHERIRSGLAGVGLGLAIVKSITEAHDGNPGHIDGPSARCVRVVP